MARASVIVTVLWSIAFALENHDNTDAANRSVPNPYTIRSLIPFFDAAREWLALVFFVLVAASIASLIVRFRRSHGDERQQVKWLILAASIFLAFIAIPVEHGTGGVADEFLGVVLALIPASVGIAILKYRLYDVDVVIKKTVVFTLVASVLTALYSGVIALATIGTVSRILAGILLLVVTFNPVRRAARSLADRLVYGRRATSYEVLADFSEHMAGDLRDRRRASADGADPRRRHRGHDGNGVVARGGRTAAGCHQRRGPASDGRCAGRRVAGDHRRPRRRGPPPRRAARGAHGLDTRERSFGSGTSEIGERPRVAGEPGAPQRPVDRRAQGVATAPRRGTGRGAPPARAEPARRGAATARRVRLAQQLTARDPDGATSMLEDVQADATDALENLRQLAHGIYPPLLADKGLVTALEAQVRRAAISVRVHGEGVERYGQDVEAAVYFSCLEALQNVAKYADATQAEIVLSNGEGELRFEVRDDGVGFDPASTGYGTGLQGSPIAWSRSRARSRSGARPDREPP